MSWKASTVDTRTQDFIKQQVEKKRVVAFGIGLILVSSLMYFEHFYYAAAGSLYTFYVAIYGVSDVVEKWQYTIRWHGQKEPTDYFRIYSTDYEKREVAKAFTRMQRTKFGFPILFTSFVLSFFYETGAYVLLAIAPLLFFYIRYSKDDIPWQSQL